PSLSAFDGSRDSLWSRSLHCISAAPSSALQAARSQLPSPPSDEPEPPCKSGQLKKDLGLEVSSARHAARLEISEVMKFFFVGSNRSRPEWKLLKIDGHACQSEALS